MKTYTKRLASGEGTVSGMYDLGSFYASVWYFEDDRKVLLETWNTNGSLEEQQATRAMVRGFVDSYAAAN